MVLYKLVSKFCGRKKKIQFTELKVSCVFFPLASKREGLEAAEMNR